MKKPKFRYGEIVCAVWHNEAGTKRTVISHIENIHNINDKWYYVIKIIDPTTENGLTPKYKFFTQSELIHPGMIKDITF